MNFFSFIFHRNDDKKKEEEEDKWRFPTMKGGAAQGLTTGDKETFKRRPYIAFAREILQNSTDARLPNSDKPVEVEFHSFTISTNRIPDIEGLKTQITRCLRLWSNEKDCKAKYERMFKELSNPTIDCLRISDFNTIGLRGVNSNIADKNNFWALTRGSGISFKPDDISGGSKGVGKNAAINLSDLDLIFYSTCTDSGEIGGLGVANYVSGYPDDTSTTNDILTHGEGYYSRNDTNDAISGFVDIDPDFSRGNRSGTDIYIIGFKGMMKDWEKQIISSSIESFIVAIYRGKLIVKVNNVTVDNQTLGNIIDSDLITGNSRKNDIICSYRILSGTGVKTFDIDVPGFGSIPLYVLPLQKKEESLATHTCSMIRNPYMRIKSIRYNSSLAFSAMCIIENDDLGRELRKIENPQHNDWQTERLEKPEEIAKWDEILKNISNQINNDILKSLKIESSDSIDPNQAGSYLPSVDNGEDKNENGQQIEDQQKTIDQMVFTPLKLNQSHATDANYTSDSIDGLQPDIGEVDEDGEDSPLPSGSNEGRGGEPHDTDDTGKSLPGEDTILKEVMLTGIHYKLMAIDAKKGIYRIVFSSPEDHKDCYLELGILNDENKSAKVAIASGTVNGTPMSSSNPFRFGPFTIEKDKKMVIEIKTKDLHGSFASEVRVLCK